VPFLDVPPDGTHSAGDTVWRYGFRRRAGTFDMRFEGIERPVPKSFVVDRLPIVSCARA
jgi:hypothetical protein